VKAKVTPLPLSHDSDCVRTALACAPVEVSVAVIVACPGTLVAVTVAV